MVYLKLYCSMPSADGRIIGYKNVTIYKVQEQWTGLLSTHYMEHMVKIKNYMYSVQCTSWTTFFYFEPINLRMEFYGFTENILLYKTFYPMDRHMIIHGDVC